ncbi:MAG: hypothetical protein IBX44_02075 [Sulfurospirillum sp.]|nr:hypothetical protein [Sulfurospirillum sp.]
MNLDIAQNITVGYFFFDTPHFSELLRLKKTFKNFFTIDCNTLPPKLPVCDLLFLEIDTLLKEKITKLNTLAKHYGAKNLTLVSKDSDNSFLLKFALHFSMHRLLSYELDAIALEKYLYEICKKHMTQQVQVQQSEIFKQISNFIGVITLRDHELIFANEKALQIFVAKDMNALKNSLKNITPMSVLCEKNLDTQTNITLQEWEFYAFLHVMPNLRDKIITITPLKNAPKNTKDDNILNRFQFVELLKDMLLQNYAQEQNISLIFINIANYQKLISQESQALHLYDLLQNFVHKISQYKHETQKIIEWNPSFFILTCENESFESLQNALDSLHQKLIYSDFSEQVHPAIISSLFRTKNDNINEILTQIEAINARDFNSDTFKNDQFFEINDLSLYLSPSEQIHHYLKSCIANKINLKLLNIYKGLCINTNTQVIRQNDAGYFFSFEMLQGYSMELEKKSTIQSADLPHDINADVSYVDFEKSLVFLTNFTFAKTSANNRQHTRVQPSFRTPIMLKYDKYSYQGEIVDMSITAIAANFFQQINEKLYSQKVSLVFRLVDATHEDGFVQMAISAKLTFIGEFDKSLKVVFLLDKLEKPYDAYMLKYMYTRQKELILELKKQTKINANARKR